MRLEQVGVIYVAYGNNARQSAIESIATLRLHNNLPIAVISDEPLLDTRHIHFRSIDKGARWAKLNVDRLVEWSIVVYLDADTKINGNLGPALEILSDFDLVICPSVNQGYKMMEHIDSDERYQTLIEIGNPFPLQLQGGMILFDRLKCQKLFQVWRDEWQRWKDRDQAALLRALYQEPVKVWLLGLPWNSGDGEIVQHLFGAAR